MKNIRKYDKNFVECKAGVRKSMQRQFHKVERQSIRQFCSAFLGSDNGVCNLDARYAMPDRVIGSNAVNWMF